MDNNGEELVHAGFAFGCRVRTHVRTVPLNRSGNMVGMRLTPHADALAPFIRAKSLAFDTSGTAVA